ncbi:MAG: protein-L-isoaspartate O-methyltransferase [Desulfarculaceae bacterium]|nr:protein-L-isoaspartate O-methyltransferase [Desulfarculaceae bacterium]MCF8071458.1 protein-L-isoaspartate O-methyltransferase [Desulfarculaceae bacterium]MCF8103414.1 protein-L-isoaspartate O-methyltransferase [Desulfarculaceae bacterium]MCF8118179.1 protein-L-isoaspartate O-methyltransferase [Desulfarculaceae bacterium]
MSAPGPIGLAQVEAALREHHQGLESTYKVTPAGMWTCSQTHEVHQLLSNLDLSPYRHLADLGSGDGRVVLLASLFLPATGLEADPELVAASQKMAAGLGLSQARFFCADCRQADLSPYDLMFIYPDKPLDWLVERLPPDWPGSLLVYGPYFQPSGLRHLRTLYAGETLCTMWHR